MQFLLPLLLLLTGLLAGKIIEKRHLKRLDAKEAELKGIIQCNLGSTTKVISASDSTLVSGSVVIATDHFKVFLAFFRNIFGGEMKSYNSLMIRARREAIVRMLEEAKVFNARIVTNIRFETATIQGKKKYGGIEVFAYGTAIKTL